MEIITINNHAFLLPGLPARYRTNCSGEWGCFVIDEPIKGMNYKTAHKAKMTRGSWIELALAKAETKTLTFEPNYICEQFLEIWGVPVAGEIKDEFAGNSSALITFLIHRRSRDGVLRLADSLGKQAFSEWVAQGMQGDPNQFAMTKAAELFVTRIFRFEFVPEVSKQGANYHWVKVSERDPKSELDFAALEAVKLIKSNYNGHLFDQRIEHNQIQALENAGIMRDATVAIPAIAPAQ